MMHLSLVTTDSGEKYQSKEQLSEPSVEHSENFNMSQDEIAMEVGFLGPTLSRTEKLKISLKKNHMK